MAPLHVATEGPTDTAPAFPSACAPMPPIDKDDAEVPPPCPTSVSLASPTNLHQDDDKYLRNRRLFAVGICLLILTCLLIATTVVFAVVVLNERGGSEAVPSSPVPTKPSATTITAAQRPDVNPTGVSTPQPTETPFVDASNISNVFSNYPGNTSAAPSMDPHSSVHAPIMPTIRTTTPMPTSTNAQSPTLTPTVSSNVGSPPPTFWGVPPQLELLTPTLTAQPTSTTRAISRHPTLPPKDYYVYHSVPSGVLDLRGWEQSGISGGTNNVLESQLGSCNPPSGVSETCCLGGFSTGGDVSVLTRGQCSSAMLDVDVLRQHVQDFFKDNPVSGATAIFKCDVCVIVELARQKNLRLSFVGDSTQNQVAEGFACELERRNYLVERETVLVNQEHDGTWENRRHLTSRILRIRSPLWDPDTIVTVHYHQLYLLPTIDASHMDEITGNSDIVVLGFGLHWWNSNEIPFTFRRAESYTSAMEDLLRRTAEQGHVQLLVHRETSAEHYDSPGGDWYQWNSNPAQSKSNLCEPLDPSDPDVVWREESVAKAAEETGYDMIHAGADMPVFPSTSGNPELVVLPYLKFTTQQYTQHPFRGTHQDCTHYCSTPFLYMTLWRSLRLAMDRQFT